MRAEMARRGLTQSDLGTALGLTQQATSRRLLGQVEFNSTELCATAELFGVTLEYLVGDQIAKAGA